LLAIKFSAGTGIARAARVRAQCRPARQNRQPTGIPPRELMKYLVSAFLAFTAATALAHAKLQTSEPAAGTTVTAPVTIKLQYNEAVEAAMSVVKLVGPDGIAVQVGKPFLADGDSKTLVATVPKLPAGEYSIHWSTMGHDGHHTKGEFRFTVK
jgi:methionine-rich copper-binding protein CopC